MMPTLLSFDSEFTSLFPPGEICISIDAIYQRQAKPVTGFSFGYQLS